MEKRLLAIQVAWKLYGTPYRWGGDDFSSYDCSGDIVEILKSVGKLPNVGDWTANNLRWMFNAHWINPGEVELVNPGCVACYGQVDHITHVMMCIDSMYCIGATGGNSTTRTLEDAIRQNAFVKVRPIDYRGDLVGFFDPFMGD